jgi:hypothetical protein
VFSFDDVTLAISKADDDEATFFVSDSEKKNG